MYHEIWNSDFMEYPMVHCVRGKKNKSAEWLGSKSPKGSFKGVTSLSVTWRMMQRLSLICVLSHVWFFVTSGTVAHQAPLSMGILQAILEWVAMPSSRGSSQPRDRTQVSHIAVRFFAIWAQGSLSLLYAQTIMQGKRKGCVSGGVRLEF